MEKIHTETFSLTMVLSGTENPVGVGFRLECILYWKGREISVSLFTTGSTCHTIIAKLLLQFRLCWAGKCTFS